MPCEAGTLIPFFSGAVVALVAALITHIFAIRRESQNRKHADNLARRARKRDFLSFMDRWRARIERRNSLQVAGEFFERVVEFRGEQAKIRDDFVVHETRSRFDELIKNLASMRDSEVEKSSGTKEIGKDELVSRLDKIVEFVRSN